MKSDARADVRPALPKPRSAEADALRAVACLAVLTMHVVSAAGRGRTDSSATIVALSAVYQGLLWATPIFAVLSGLLLTLSRRVGEPATSFWRRRMSLVTIPYVVWSGIYWAAFSDQSTHPEVALAWLLGRAGQGHLYFICAIVQFYLIFPWLDRWVRARPAWLTAGTAMAVTFCYQTALAYVPRPAGPAAVLWEYQHSFLPAWIGYLVLGMILAGRPEVLRPAPSPAALLRALGTAAAAYLFILAEMRWLPVPDGGHTSHRPTIILLATALLPLLIRLAARLAESRLLPALGTVAANSFAIYLAHPLLLSGIILWLSPRIHPWFTLLIAWPACLVATLALIAVLDRIPGGAWLIARREARLGGMWPGIQPRLSGVRGAP